MATGNTQEKIYTAVALVFEATHWSAAEKLKGNMDAGEYKHVVLGLIFLKYISDAFEERHAALAELRDALLPKLLSGELRVPVELKEAVA